METTRKQVLDAEAGQRAWLQIFDIRAERINNSPYPSWYQLKLAFVVKNYGSTPAIDINVPNALFNPGNTNAYKAGGRKPMPVTGGPTIMPQDVLTNFMGPIGAAPNGADFRIEQWVDFRDVFSNEWTVGAFGVYSYSNNAFYQTGMFTDQFHHSQGTN
jgi:hypothetical protein